MKQIIFLIIILVVSSGALSAGDIDAQLNDRLANMSVDQTTKVWIKLHDVESTKALKSKLAAVASRQERHRQAYNQLHENHQQAQRNLMGFLKSLVASSRNKSIKQRWITNLIEAELSADEIREIAKHPDVALVIAEPKLINMKASSAKTAAPKTAGTAGVGSNLTAINAPNAWVAGYTGAGRIVCSFDNGVFGDHPALKGSWQGLNGDTAAAWFDPARGNPFPTAIGAHGTHVMGIIVGHDDITKDTVGVAPGAKWISAAVASVSGAVALDGFEWAVDPDGDPNSLDDVPDVINHSWGVEGIGCANAFFDIIENVEALGIVNIFAAGNTGSQGASSIWNPAIRARDSIDCFAVGNVDTSGNIHFTSSRGPSLCNAGAIKPNVVAPGTDIRSTWPNGDYYPQMGTSMAAPHVSGLVALLREKNPNATVDEIKTAILTSADNQSSPNNDVGWGMIDCMAALNALDGTVTTPNVRLYAFDHLPISPGDVVTGDVVLQNLGMVVFNVSASLVDNNPSLSVINGNLNFGDLYLNDTVRSSNPISVQVDDTVTVGSILSLDMNITGGFGSFNKTVKLFFVVEPKQNFSELDHTVNNIDFTISNYGTYGLSNGSFLPRGGLGFNYKNGGNDLWQMGLMIGRNFQSVSDGVHYVTGEPDNDFSVAPGGNLIYVTGYPNVEQTHSVFDDYRAENPNEIRVEQESFAFDYDPYLDFIIIRYVITNIGSSSLFNLYVGLYSDWDLANLSSNVGGYDFTNEFSWMSSDPGEIQVDYRGVKILDQPTVTSFTNPASYIDFSATGDGFTNVEKITALAHGFVTADTFSTLRKDLFQVTAGSMSLSAGSSDTITFALLAGDTYSDLINASINAQAAYDGVITDIEEIVIGGELPSQFALHQNYPNPFNPSTSIQFDLPRASDYNLSIYNINGQKIEEIQSHAKAGQITVKWDAGNYSSGIYLYKLTAGEFSSSRKMILLK